MHPPGGSPAPCRPDVPSAGGGGSAPNHPGLPTWPRPDRSEGRSKDFALPCCIATCWQEQLPSDAAILLPPTHPPATAAAAQVGLHLRLRERVTERKRDGASGAALTEATEVLTNTDTVEGSGESGGRSYVTGRAERTTELLLLPCDDPEVLGHIHRLTAATAVAEGLCVQIRADELGRVRRLAAAAGLEGQLEQLVGEARAAVLRALKQGLAPGASDHWVAGAQPLEPEAGRQPEPEQGQREGLVMTRSRAASALRQAAAGLVGPPVQQAAADGPMSQEQLLMPPPSSRQPASRQGSQQQPGSEGLAPPAGALAATMLFRDAERLARKAAEAARPAPPRRPQGPKRAVGQHPRTGSVPGTREGSEAALGGGSQAYGADETQGHVPGGSQRTSEVPAGSGALLRAHPPKGPGVKVNVHGRAARMLDAVVLQREQQQAGSKRPAGDPGSAGPTKKARTEQGGRPPWR